MKAVRQVVGFAWICIFIWGVVALVRGQWVAFGIAFVLWWVVGAIFAAVHNALERSEVGSIEHLFRAIGFAVEQGDWESALAGSQKALTTATNAANRDRSLLGGGGNGDSMLPALGIALLNHGALLGATGRTSEGREALNRGTEILNRAGAGNAHAQQFVRMVDELRSPAADNSDFQRVARAINATV